MNMAFEADVRVQNDHAVRCSIVSNPVYVVEYIKAISSLVGASHILAVFEETDAIKVYFDDKRHVDILIKKCLHVMGHHVTVDYVIAPGTKLILSSVDPVISNYDIMRLLASYGTVVSPVIRPPISDDIELCHIGYGVRSVYMDLNGCIPERLEFKYGDQLGYIKVRVVENSDTLMLPYIKTDDVERNPTEVESNSTTHTNDATLPVSSDVDIPILEAVDPILVSVQSVPEANSKELIEFSNGQILNGKESLSGSSVVSNREEVIIMPRRRGRPRVNKRKEITATSQAAKRIKKNFKHKWMTKRYKNRKGRFIKKPFRKSMPEPVQSVWDENEHSLDFSRAVPDELEYEEENISNVNGTTNFVLNKKQLLLYLDEVKGNRAPLELAKKYIGDDCDSQKVHKFIDQLQEYNMSHDDINLKSRIWRIIKSITDSLINELNLN